MHRFYADGLGEIGSLVTLSEEDARAFEYYIVNGSESFKTKVKYPLGLYEK